MKAKQTDEIEEKSDAKPADNTQILIDTLIYLRDNVVHGNPNHVQRINSALES